LRNLVFIVGFVLLPFAARATEGVQAAVRGGFSLPVGADASSSIFSPSFSGFFPLGIEAGYRVDHLYFGVFGEWAPGLPKDCAAGADCSGHSIAGGVAIRYQSVDRNTRPWVGVNAAYERLSAKMLTGQGGSEDAVFEGYRLGVEGGVDFSAGSWLAIGPYLGASLGGYESGSGSVNGGPSSGSTPDKSLHGLLSVGLRVSFLP
jgi:hypothetical protein